MRRPPPRMTVEFAYPLLATAVVAALLIGWTCLSMRWLQSREGIVLLSETPRSEQYEL